MENTEVVQKENEKLPTTPVGDSVILNKEVPAINTSKEPAVVAESQPRPTPVQPQPANRPRSTKEDKMRKKDDKSVDHVLKALNSLNTSEEKLAAMCKKYADIFDENRKIQLALKQADKRCCTLQREKEQLQTDHSKAILTRSRLENLCRELQRQNKAIKDESLLKIREEEEKRKEVSAKFQATLNEVTTLMQQNNDKNMKLRDDNIDINAKLKNVWEQYELREQQVEKISKQMQLESQLADAKLAKAKMEMAAEKEIMLREKQQLLLELAQYQGRCQQLQATEINLRNQISLYDDKYDEFQKALARSNEIFGGFKGEMEKMSKKVSKLEKEVSMWKKRWEGSHKAMLEMAEEKQNCDQELSHSARQLETLQRLCRTLQAERTSLLSKLKEQQPSDVKISDMNTTDTEEGNLKENQINGELQLNVSTPESNSSVNKPICETVVKDGVDSDKIEESSDSDKVNLAINDSSTVVNQSALLAVEEKNSSETNNLLNGSIVQPVAISESNKNLATNELTVNSCNSPINVSSVTPATSCSNDNSKSKSTSIIVAENINTAANTSVNDISALPDRVTNTSQEPITSSSKESLPTHNETTPIEQCIITDVLSKESLTISTATSPPSQDNGAVLEPNNVEEKKELTDNLIAASTTNTSDSVKERPSKKQNNDAKKGKESKKKKKNS